MRLAQCFICYTILTNARWDLLGKGVVSASSTSLLLRSTSATSSLTPLISKNNEAVSATPNERLYTPNIKRSQDRSSKILDGSWAECTGDDYTISNIPICTPRNGSNLVKDDQYAITWDPEPFNGSETVTIILRYELGNTTKGRIIIDSGPIPLGKGFYTLKIKDEWLRGKWNQTAAVLISPSHVVQGHSGPWRGPTVFLQRSEEGEPPKKRKGDASIEIAVGIPLSLFGLVALIWIWFYMVRRSMRLPKSLLTPKLGRPNTSRRRKNTDYEAVRAEDHGDDIENAYELNRSKRID